MITLPAIRPPTPSLPFLPSLSFLPSLPFPSSLPSLSLSTSSPSFLLALFLFLLPSVLSLHCYECFDRSRPCTRFSNCSGSACILYENLPKRTSIAFCLLISPVARKDGAELAQGCWRDDGTSGVECVCTGQFCNIPRDPRASDPNSSPVIGLKMLQRNPFVDYEYLDDEKAAILGDGGKKTEGRGEENIVEETQLTEQYLDEEEEDLMPLALADYFEWEKRFRGASKMTEPPQKSQADSAPYSHATAFPPTEIGISIGFDQNDTAVVRQPPPVDGTIRTGDDDNSSSAHLGSVPWKKFLLLTITPNQMVRLDSFDHLAVNTEEEEEAEESNRKRNKMMGGRKAGKDEEEEQERKEEEEQERSDRKGIEEE
ncbi:hypothetical protein niasHS_017506 [Heterodera schachtii]|uniref:Uncharacterized protein n=1 Tax=Heterodera schachtii TaxID=97005 RepID=A0ABD2HXA1_HETSC